MKKSTKCSKKLPPGPPGLPIFGNMFELGTEPYKKVSCLKQKYGPVLWLKLGTSTNFMVVQTAQAAEELFKNHDVYSYCEGSLAIGDMAPFGFQRRICTVEIETVPVKRKCVDDMLKWIEKAVNSAEKGSGIEVTHFVFLASFNMLGNLILSKDLADPESEEASEFFNAMKGINECAGIANISDIFPLFRKFDLQCLRKEMARNGEGHGNHVYVSQGSEEERKEGAEKRNDFLDVLLEFEGTGKDEPAKLSEHEIKIFVLELFLAGTETTSSSVEWALTELLRHPQAMDKVKTEISKVIGPNRKFEESDIDNLPCMQAVIKESLRLHPPLPFLIPRETIQDTKFMGYDIPKGTQVLVNAWAIGRDLECWDDPMSFKPERFLGTKIDMKGQHYGLIPFGAGRRMCVGLPLGHRMMHFALGSLLHEFDWELPDGVSPKSINMNESMGVTARKRDSLKVIPKKA
ncbi:hypothetical protein H5410_064654 [Solanum commersonii]|uniref:Cytochrome P450 n=1 Tax=Solanum commersonii TaxID=4109 RepID=A0A9J5VYS2_SOLCO|nr:hypothetical protein H5410_064654 [Solanum commersonii]